MKDRLFSSSMNSPAHLASPETILGLQSLDINIPDPANLAGKDTIQHAALGGHCPPAKLAMPDTILQQPTIRYLDG